MYSATYITNQYLFIVEVGHSRAETDHGGDPLASMDGCMEDDGGVLAGASATVEVDTGERAALARRTLLNGDSIVGVALLEICQELEMVLVWVV